jgi:hypothetical protein
MTPPSDAERDRLFEEVISAYRRRDPRGGVSPSPAFYDLAERDRESAFDEALRLRAIEAAIDAGGQSTTVKAALAIIEGRR